MYTCILEAYSVYCTGYVLSKQCNELSLSYILVLSRVLASCFRPLFLVKSFNQGLPSTNGRLYT